MPRWCLIMVVAALAGLGPMPAAADGFAGQLLPAEEVARKVLLELPQVQAARAYLGAEEANARRIAAGTHEWTVRALGQRRTDNFGTRYLENEIAVERAVRLPGKAGKDQALGAAGVEVAQARLADVWHESARSLQRGWFEWLREERNARRLQEHARLLEQQLGIVRKRVQAGDAPRLEEMLADTELQRALAAQAQSAARAGRQLVELRLRFPGLILQAPATLPEPAMPAGEPEDWQRAILDHNHEIELAELEAAQARLTAERVVLERRPDPTLGVRYAQERDRQEKILGVIVSVPFSGTARSAAADAALLRARAAEEKSRETRLRVQSDAAQVAQRTQSAVRLAAQFSRITSQSDANARLIGKAYSLGEAPLSDTLLARRQALDALTQYEQAQLDAWEAHARLLLDMHRLWSLREHHGPQ